MTPEISMLAFSAAAIAFVHTILGPDHYLPFVAMSKARGWSMAKALRITLVCGIGHLAGSVLLGVLGITLGLQLSSVAWLEGFRGNLAAWLLVGFGLAYMAWGLRHAHRNRPHTHWHHHDGLTHLHEHTHHEAHAHVHDQQAGAKSLAPWLVFIIFVLGPCEPLIPLLMYPAARESAGGVIVVTLVFGFVTVLTMLLSVGIALLGLKSVKLHKLEPFAHAVAGGTILACGLGIILLGL
jgi:nickel/cobalt exporter